MKELVAKIANELSLNERPAQNAIKLLFEDDCSIPFVARYRKEQTDSMNEVDLRKLRDAYAYMTELEALKERYIKVIKEHSQSKPQVAKELPTLLKKIADCKTKQELEDIYLPFKPKRVTKAQKAKEKGIEPLVDLILSSYENQSSLDAMIQELRKSLIAPHTELSDEELLEGARYILAERIYETSEIKKRVRETSRETGTLEASPKTPREEITDSKLRNLYDKYENYFSYSEPLEKVASHRVMALRRGEADKVLRVKIELDKDLILSQIWEEVSNCNIYSSETEQWLKTAVKEAYTRHLAPSIETELRLELKKSAESDAINVFSKNLEKLLMLPIIPEQVVMGIDPGIRTGSKVAVISKTAKLLAYTTVFPDLKDYDSERTEEAMTAIRALIEKYDVSYISVGNGTGGREVESHVRTLIKEMGMNKAIRSVLVNESGASVYSVEPIAIEEFPDLDPTIRSAVSIARRLQDPLAELVKIEPRSIGVGQYQHDCNALRLNDSLKDVVESCVNRVGVNINTASHKLLSYISGVGPSLGKKIVEYRDTKGPFNSRQDFLKIPSFGEKTFLQAAGFLRVPESQNVLDKTSVHPERYPLVEKIAQDKNIDLNELVKDSEKASSLDWESYESPEIGLPTLLDIKKELLSPGRDPRKDGSKISYTKSLMSLNELKLDMKLKGTVSNVTNFGAFVDIGLHQDGLVHISELSDEFVKDPSLVVSVGDVLNVTVIGIDLKRKRISLSCRSEAKATETPAPSQKPVATQNPGNTKPRSFGERAKPRSFGAEQRSSGERQERRPPSSFKPREQRTSFSQNGNANRNLNSNGNGNGNGNGSGNRHSRPQAAGSRKPFRKSPRVEKSFSVGDLLSKFNGNR